MKGFVVLPRRWVGERTFSWLGRNRRLNEAYESLADPVSTPLTQIMESFKMRSQLGLYRGARRRPGWPAAARG
jgi:transposase